MKRILIITAMCTAAVAAPAEARQSGALAPARAQPEIDASRVDASTRQSFSRFWSGMSSREAAALQRQLEQLETRAERGENVNAEVRRLRAQHPQLFQLAGQLDGQTFHLVSRGGGEDEGTVECNGIGWIGINGKVRCIGKLVVNS